MEFGRHAELAARHTFNAGATHVWRQLVNVLPDRALLVSTSRRKRELCTIHQPADEDDALFVGELVLEFLRFAVEIRGDIIGSRRGLEPLFLGSDAECAVDVGRLHGISALEQFGTFWRLGSTLSRFGQLSALGPKYGLRPRSLMVPGRYRLSKSFPNF